jgi:hypothetical protein
VVVTAGEERSFRLAPTCPFSILLYECASFSVFSLTLWRCLFQVSTYDGTKQSYGKNNESPDSIQKSSKKNGEAHNEFLPSYLAANPPVDVRNGSTEGGEVGRWFGVAVAADGLSPAGFPLGAWVPSRLGVNLPSGPLSNRACSSPAHGFPTPFIVRHAQRPISGRFQ